jgi:hypothetical protein
VGSIAYVLSSKTKARPRVAPPGGDAAADRAAA